MKVDSRQRGAREEREKKNDNRERLVLAFITLVRSD